MRNGNIQKNMMQVRLAKNKNNHSPLKETFEPHLLGELWPPCQQQKDVLGSSSKETECAPLSNPWDDDPVDNFQIKKNFLETYCCKHLLLIIFF